MSAYNPRTHSFSKLLLAHNRPLAAPSPEPSVAEALEVLSNWLDCNGASQRQIAAAAGLGVSTVYRKVDRMTASSLLKLDDLRLHAPTTAQIIRMSRR